MKKSYDFVKKIVWLTQLGLGIAAPLVLCVLGSVWLMDRFQLGAWVIAAGTLLGVGGAFSSLWRSLKAMDREARADDQDSGVGFNQHK